MKQKSGLEIVRQVFIKAELDPEPLEGANGLIVHFEEGPQVSGLAFVDDDNSQFLFYLQFRQSVPKTSLSEVGEFITRVNYGLTAGNFELDYNSGSVRFKTYVDYLDAELDGALVRNAILAGMETVEIYSEALNEVASGVSSPIQAIANAEIDLNEEQ